MKAGTIVTGTCRGCSQEFGYVSKPGRRREWCSERCRKKSYNVPCIDCGVMVDGTTPSRMTGRCTVCSKAHFSSEVRAAHIAAIQRWAAIYGEPPASPDWNVTKARYMKDVERVERFRAGSWPSAKAVIKSFGTWNAAIMAAGFTPRRSGGVPENHLRKRAVRDELERAA
jgi:hypothetical protein